jgi:hypothetical protein
MLKLISKFRNECTKKYVDFCLFQAQVVLILLGTL